MTHLRWWQCRCQVKPRPSDILHRPDRFHRGPASGFTDPHVSTEGQSAGFTSVETRSMKPPGNWIVISGRSVERPLNASFFRAVSADLHQHQCQAFRVRHGLYMGLDSRTLVFFGIGATQTDDRTFVETSSRPYELKTLTRCKSHPV